MSIDGRPLTTARGFMKDVNKVYRKYLRNSLSENTALSKKIFLLLRLRCYSGAYDVNIEPAKNEVLFDDPNPVLELFESLCKRVYGDVITPKKARSADRIDRIESDSRDFDILLARKIPDNHDDDGRDSHVDMSSPSKRAAPEATTTNPNLNHQQATASINTKPLNNGDCNTMSDDDEGDAQTESNIPSIRAVSEHEEESDDENIMNCNITNPFTLAKINSRIRPRNMLNESFAMSQTGPQSPGEGEQVLPELGNGGGISPLSMTITNPLPSPGASPEREQTLQNPGPPNRPWKKLSKSRSETAGSSFPSEVSTLVAPVAHRTLLDSWTKSINSSSPVNQSLQSAISSSGLSSVSDSPPNVSLRNSSVTRHSDIEEGIDKAIRQKPFRSPLEKKSEKQDATLADQMVMNSFLAPELNPHGDSTLASNEIPNQVNLLTDYRRPDIEPLSELDDIMDFEHRKRYSILQHRNKNAKIPANSGPLETRQEHISCATPKVSALDEAHALEIIANDDLYASKFGHGEETSEDDFIPPQPKSASYTQNPHRNRYIKAIQDLETGSRSKKLKLDSGLDEEDFRDHAKETLSKARSDRKGHEARKVFHSDDPRAFLILQQGNDQHEGHSGRAKKLRLSKLPFETIDSDIATYQLSCAVPEVHEINVGSLTKVANVLKDSDPYILLGSIDTAFSGQAVDRNTLMFWESKVGQMLEQYNFSLSVETG